MFIVTFGAALFLYWLFSLIDCVKRDFANSSEKVVWVLVLIFVGILGAFIYNIVVKPELGTVGKVIKYLVIVAAIFFLVFLVAPLIA